MAMTRAAMKTRKFYNNVNLAGSIASITGVSLLWLQSVSPKLNILVAVPILAVAGLFVIGLLALAWAIFKIGYFYMVEIFAANSRLETTVKIAYSCIAGALLLSLWSIAAWFIYLGASVGIRQGGF
jgi:hypothetical protein